ncbi:MAG: hypothetical protein AB1656_02685 [Candidatus Omnitrophota bacterium]
MRNQGDTVFSHFRKLNRDHRGKGEIMKRVIIGNLMRVRSILGLIFALALLASGSAMAQPLLDASAMKFVNLDVSFYNGQGSTGYSTVAGKTVRYVSGIFYAKDSGTRIYDLTRDGKIDVTAVQGQFLAGGDKPILANIENGDLLQLFAVVTGVPSASVTAIQNTADADAIAAVKSVIKATLCVDPANLKSILPLWDQTTVPSSLYANVSPTSVTGITADNVYGITGLKANTVVCSWNISQLVMAATDPDARMYGSGLTANLQIVGSLIADASTGVSNLTGYEITSSSGKMTGPEISTIQIDDATDTVSKLLANPAAVDTPDHAARWTELNPNQRLTTELPFQFRAGDIVTFKAVINPNADKDGEPDAYFAANSDPFYVLNSSSPNKTAGEAHVNLTPSGQTAYVKTATGEVTISMTIKNRSIVDFSSMYNIFSYTQPSGANMILYVTGQMKDDLVTFGEYENLLFTLAISDDVGAATNTALGDGYGTEGTAYVYAGNQGTTATYANSNDAFFADTTGVLVTELAMYGEDSTSPHNQNFVSSLPQNHKVGPGYTTTLNEWNDEAFLAMKIIGGNENANTLSWLNIQVLTDPAGTNPWSEWANDDSVIANKAYNTTYTAAGGSSVGNASSFIATVPNVPSGTIPGASVTVRLLAAVNPTTQLNPGAGVILKVSDDARNPALVYEINDQKKTGSIGLSDLKSPLSSTSYINSVFKYAAVTDLSSSSFKGKLVGPATVAIDAVAPEIQAVTFVVSALPDGYFDGSTSTSDAFKNLAYQTEILSTTMNKFVVNSFSSSVLRSAIAANPNIIWVTRGTAAIPDTAYAGFPASATTTGYQNGSKVRVIVQFNTTTASTTDIDSKMPPSYTASNYVKDNFKFSLANPFIGFVTASNNRMDVRNYQNIGSSTTWSFVSGSLGTGQVAYATFDSLIGVPRSTTQALTADFRLVDLSIDNASMVVDLQDSVYNQYLNSGKPGQYSNTIILDVSRPQIAFNYTPDTWNRLIVPNYSGGKQISNCVVIVTDTNNTSLANLTIREASNSTATTVKYNPFLHPVTTLALEGNSNKGFNGSSFYFYQFLNSTAKLAGDADAIDPSTLAAGNINGSTPSVKAGYMLIISATFSEPSSLPNPEFAPFEQYVLSNDVAFPYLLDATATVSTYSIGTMVSGATNYGGFFKTISADFSDFVIGAKDVIPDATALLGYSQAGRVVGNATANDIIQATWYYLINKTSSLNTNMTATEVRQVTFAARDLSGNVTKRVIPVAYGDFNQPKVAIYDYKITNKLNTAALTLQGSTAWDTVPTTYANTAINSATIISDSTITLVVKIGNGTTGGGPFKTSGDYISGDFSGLGAPTLVGPSSISMVSSNLGVPTTYTSSSTIRTDATAGSIIYATFEIPKTSLTNVAAKDTNGAKSAQAVVTVIGSSLAEHTASTVKVDVDGTAPSGQTTYAITETSSPAGSLDSLIDPFLRAGSVYTVTAEFTRDNNDTEVNTSYTANLSNFTTGLTAASPTAVYMGPKTTGLPLVAANRVVAVWNNTVSSDAVGGNVTFSATDASKLTGSSSSSNSMFITQGAVSITNIAIDANRVINYATDTKGIVGKYEADGTGTWIAVLNVGGSTDRSDDRLGAIAKDISLVTTSVKKGDKLRILTTVSLSDAAFTNIKQAQADFTAFGAGVLTLTPAANPTQIVPAGVGIVRVTFEATVGDAPIADARLAGVTITVTDPTDKTDTKVAPGIHVDQVAPSVDSISVNYYQNGVLETDGEIDPAPSGTINKATATIIVVATYPDSSDTAGYPGSLIGALMREQQKYGTDVLQTAADGVACTLMRSVMKIDARQFAPSNLATFQANGTNQEVVPTFWKLEGAGPTAYATGSFSSIVASTNTTLTAYFGFNPVAGELGQQQKQPGLQISSSANVESASFLVYAFDQLGNYQTQKSSTSMQLDANAPSIAIPYVDVLKEGQVDGVNYTSAVYNAAGQIVRPTRVKNGTKVTAKIEVADTPKSSDQIFTTIQSLYSGFAKGFNASSLDSVSVSNGVLDLSSYASNNFHLKTSGAAGTTTLLVTFTVGSNGTTPASTFTMSPAANGDPVNIANYYNGTTAAGITVYATDTNYSATALNQNYNAGVASGVGVNQFPIEIDTEGPRVLQQAIIVVNNEVEVNAIDASSVSTYNKLQTGANYIENVPAGKYIVWAATMVVDGSSAGDFVGPILSWREKLQPETGVKRLEDGGISGKKLLVESVTRSIYLVTDVVQVVSNPLSKLPVKVGISATDIFGNALVGENETIQLAINAKGPSVTEMSLVIDGVNESMGPAYLGIGQNSIDGASASFELKPGNRIVIDATITPYSGEIPREIYADLSALYPSQIAASFNSIVPTKVELTGEGLVVAQWDKIFYFTDAFNTFPVITDSEKLGLLNGVPASATLATATGLFTYNLVNSGDVANGKVTNASLAEIVGLPYIAVQSSASPSKQAFISIRVFDNRSGFDEVITKSATFAVDSKRPTARTSYIVTKRTLDDSHPNITRFSASNQPLRVGFPFAPNLSTDLATVPNRVRSGDTVDFNIIFTNPRIDGFGDDRFVNITDNYGRLITLNTDDVATAEANLLKSVTADLSPFNSTGSNSTLLSAQYVDYVSGVNQSTVISATYQIVISDQVGLTATTSKVIRLVTGTIMDDAGNIPVSSKWDTATTLYQGGKNPSNDNKLGVDNNPPNLSTLSVSLNSGVARNSSGEQIAIGGILSANSVVEPNASLKVAVSMTESVDSPLDIFNNQNFGDITIKADGYTIPTSERIIKNIQSSGSYISGNFVVTIPAQEDGTTISAFSFLVSATDSLGNTSSQPSSALYLDASPVLTLKRNNIALTTNQFTVNADSTITVEADGFDAGGIQKLEWIINPDPAVGYAAQTDGLGFVKTAEDPTQTLDLSLSVTPAFNTDPSATNVMMATAYATDISNQIVNSSMITVNFNQPAIFDEIFPATETIAYVSDVISATIEAQTLGWNTTAGADIREVTIEEGSSLAVVVSASDANRSGNLTVTASISTNLTADSYIAKFDSMVVDSQASLIFADGIGQSVFTFVPKFTAITGSVASATFDLVLVASDGSDSDSNAIASDNATLRVNILPKKAIPELSVVSITSGDAAQSATLKDSVSVDENKKLVIVLQATDPGNDPLTFAYNTAPTPLSTFEKVEEGAGTLKVTLSYTPTYEESDLPAVNKTGDPFTLNFSFTNGVEIVSSSKEIDIVNVSQAPVISATVKVADGEAAVIKSGESVNAEAGQIVLFNFTVTDPDGDAIFVNQSVKIGDTPIDQKYIKFSQFGTTTITAVLEITVPTDVTENLLVQFSANDLKATQSTVLFTIKTTAPTPTAAIDEVVVAQGLGGSTLVTIRNFDPNSTTPVGNIIRSIKGIPNEGVIGGGQTRGAYVTLGDVDGDGKVDIVSTHTAITANAKFPNNFMVRDAATRLPVAHPKDAFPTGTIGVLPKPVEYMLGDMPAAVGDFIGAGTKQIAIAQGLYGNGLIRLFMYTGKPAPNGWVIVGQFSGLAGNASTKNASDSVTLAAGDVDNDGVDELLVGQGNSSTSQTLFHLLDIQQTGGVSGSVADVAKRTPWSGFGPKFAGNGGASYAIADINGDGTKEIVAASLGDNTGSVTSAKGSVISSFVNVIFPTIEKVDGVNTVTGFTYATQGTQTVFGTDVNPSGALSIAAGEIDGVAANGAELIIGTGSLYAVSGENTVDLKIGNIVDIGSFTITTVSPAPASKFKIVKPQFSGTTLSSYSGVKINSVDYGRFAGVSAFVGVTNPTSGAVYVGAANTDTP